jgi:arylsulfatase A-like enzyme
MGDWKAYLKGIVNTDAYVHEIWQFIQNDSIYKDNTTLFVTNDHGRHLDGISNGFVSHGDNCDGCRHINLYSFGPDFKKGIVSSVNRSLVDVHATILELLHIRGAFTEGNVMLELFN